MYIVQCSSLYFKGKGDKYIFIYSNSRGIGLLSAFSKLYFRVLIKSFPAETECAIDKEHSGLRQGKVVEGAWIKCLL